MDEWPQAEDEADRDKNDISKRPRMSKGGSALCRPGHTKMERSYRNSISPSGLEDVISSSVKLHSFPFL